MEENKVEINKNKLEIKKRVE